jgi:GNAT superfamily N-acetyltransferase
VGSIGVSLEGLNQEVRRAYTELLPDHSRYGERFLDWRFGEATGARESFAVARGEAGEIVGLSAYISASFRLGAQERGRGLQAIDSIVAPSARGQGVFTKLAGAMSKAATGEGRADLIWGFPNANAAPAWFKKLDWTRHGFVPFMIKPLRAGYILRRARLPINFRLSLLADRGGPEAASVDAHAGEMWDRFAGNQISCAVDRSSAFLNWRLFEAPHRKYRVAYDSRPDGALVASTIENKHGGRIAYVMEALGGSSLRDLLAAELGRHVAQGAEVALSWCFPWSPNYRVYRSLGFFPLPERLRPIEMHFGGRTYTPRANAVAGDPKNWYLSYLDSDTV